MTVDIYTDSTFTNRAMAEERMNTLDEGIPRRAALFEPGPAPLLKQWVPIWMNSRLVGEAGLLRRALAWSIVARRSR